MFTELRAFQVPFRKIIFFDLETVIRPSPRELFQVHAPSGMYHRWGNSVGCVPRKIQPQLHQRRADALEPSKYIERKKSLVEEMLAEVEQIDERDKSNVPEQYDLVNKTPGWRHVTVSWICEVNLFQYMDTHGRGLRTAQQEMPQD